MLTSLWAQWRLEPGVLLVLAVAAALYAAAQRRAPDRAGAGGQAAFGAGLGVLFLALASPLDRLADAYLLSAHMLQHMALVAVAPLLLLLGLPPAQAERLLRRPLAWVLRRLWARAFPPLLFALTLSLWHLPALYDAALASRPLHTVEHASFFGAALIFWWPLLRPGAVAGRPALGARLAGLLGAAVAGMLLGAILTLAPGPLYTTYLSPADPLGLRPALHDLGLTPLVDQQLAGLLMWVPGGFIFLGAMLITLGRWLDGWADAEPEPAVGQ